MQKGFKILSFSNYPCPRSILFVGRRAESENIQLLPNRPHEFLKFIHVSWSSSTLMIVRVGKEAHLSGVVRDEGKGGRRNLRLLIHPIFSFWNLARKMSREYIPSGWVRLEVTMVFLSTDLFAFSPPTPSSVQKNLLILTGLPGLTF